MRHRKLRRFRHRSNGRGHQHRINGKDQPLLGSSSFSSERIRGNFKSQQSPDRLVEKYNSLAKEALTSGDKILSENYLQHADHFMRIITVRNLNQGNAVNDGTSKTFEENSVKNKEVDKNKIVEEKK